jgi:hypothetical protein
MVGVGTTGNVVWAIKTDNASSYSEPNGNRPDNAPLVQYQADMYLVGNKSTPIVSDYLWFAKENYVISNGGAIRTPNDFTNSSSDPFTLLKDNALESVMYIKGSNAVASAVNTNSDAKSAISDNDYFSGVGGNTNIDIVFIPDLIVAAVQRMLPAITNLKN